MSIGERICELRKAQNISQAQLAQALDVSRQAVSKWENDQMTPDSLKLIHLADLLDTDIEYLTTGRKSYGRRPPVVIKEVQTVEKVVEKPVEIEKVVEKIVEIEKIVEVEKPVERLIEKPVIKKVIRTKYIRNPIEYAITGAVCFIIGILLGLIL